MNADIDFYRDLLGFRFMEYTVLEPASQEPFFAQLSNTEQAHDLALISDNAGMPARSHHFAYWVDQTHVREPGGHRVEVFSGGYRNYQPDWEAVRWVADQGGIDMHRNWPAPESLLEAFPSRDAPAAAVVDADVNPWALPGVS
jgi:catechol 2,3-dioxygenase